MHKTEETERSTRIMASSATRRALSSSSAKHYLTHNTSQTYESAFFYSKGEYMTYLSNEVQKIFKFSQNNSSQTLVDIGGGTGSFTQMIIEKHKNIRGLVVDPFLSMTENHYNLEFLKASAQQFITTNTCYDYCLMKEVIHHFDSKDRLEIVRGIYQQLNSSPKSSCILIITRPKYEVDYPLWPDALKVWADNQPHADEIQYDLKEVGFLNVHYDLVTYPCSIELQKWLNMVKGRCWSTFSHFTDDQLLHACEKIERNAQVNQDGVINFQDKLLFITGFKV